MNSVPIVTKNSALSQNLVKCTGCTPLAQAARPLSPGSAHDTVSWCALSCIVAHTGPCRGPLPVVSQESPVLSLRAHARCAPCRSKAAFYPRSRYKIVSRPNPWPTRTTSRVARAPGHIAGRVTTLYRSPDALYYDSIAAPQPRYNALYHDSP